MHATRPPCVARITDAFVFAVTFALFLFTTAPGRSFMDSGELGAAAYTLGVAHPTGFPAYLLGGKAAMLFPMGEAALRLNLFSALAGALACVFSAWVARALNGGRAPIATGLAASVLCALGATFWTQANVIEVYAPSLCMTLLALHLAARVARHPDDARGLFVLALAVGVSCGFHATLRLVAVAVVVALIARKDTRRLVLHNAGTAFAALLLGFAAQLYLPLASATGPFADWGSPHTFARFVDHLMAARIRRAFDSEMGSLDPERLAHHGGTLAEHAAEVVTWPGLLLVLLGLVVAARKASVLGIAATLVFLGDALFAIFLNPMGLAERQTGLTAEAFCAIFAAVALGAGISFARDPMRSRLAGVAFRTAAIVGFLMIAAFSAIGADDEKLRQGDHGAADLVDATLAELPAGAVVFTRSDDLCAGIVYARLVDGARPDVIHVVRQHVWDRHYLRRTAAPLLRGDDDPALGDDRESRITAQEMTLRRLVVTARAQGRAVAWEPGGDDSALGAGLALVPEGLLFRALGDGETRAPRGVGQGTRAKLAAILAASPRQGPATRRYVATLWDRLGRAFSVAASRDLPESRRAELAFREALRIDPDHASAWNNLAAFLARTGRRKDAAIAAARAARLEPLRVTYAANLGLFRLQVGDDAGARVAYQRTLALAPKDPRAHVGLGLLAARAGRLAEAKVLLLRALELGARGDTRVDALANLRKLGVAPPEPSW